MNKIKFVNSTDLSDATEEIWTKARDKFSTQSDLTTHTTDATVHVTQALLNRIGTLENLVFNGHEYVDLGLPSGTLWATMNVGASSETDYGNYYQYGKGANDIFVTYTENAYTGTENPLDLSVDTARLVWHGEWHMPTLTQIEELINNTTYTSETIDGINCGKLTALNGNYIILPFSGYYDWRSIESMPSLNGVGTSGCYMPSTLKDQNFYLSISSSGAAKAYCVMQNPAFSVRPVIG